MKVHVEKLTAIALYDSGANISIITEAFLRKLGKKININKSYTFKTVSGVGTINGIIELNLKIFNIHKLMKFFVMSKSLGKYDLILGLDSITQFQLRQDENLKITQKKLKRNSKMNIKKMTNKNTTIEINWNEYIPIQDFEAKTNHLNNEEKTEIYNIIDEYDTLFAKNRYDVGTVCNNMAQIKLMENKYTYKKPYRCSIEDQQIIEEQISELLKYGLIEPSCSPFAAPVTLAYKKDEGKKQTLH